MPKDDQGNYYVGVVPKETEAKEVIAVGKKKPKKPKPKPK